MDKGEIQKVQVEIVVEDGPNTYTFIRSQEFRKVRDDNEDLTVAPNIIVTFLLLSQENTSSFLPLYLIKLVIIIFLNFIRLSLLFYLSYDVV